MIGTDSDGYVYSPVARDKIRELAHEYILGFLYNPGGGEFTHRLYGPTCQISTEDDNEDLKRLEAWLVVHGEEIKRRNREAGWVPQP
jgi:hypothetical protein